MKLFELLVESRVDYLRDKYVPLIKEKYKIPQVHALNFFDKFKNNDPTNNKIYLQWFLNETLKTIKTYRDVNNFIIEDGYKWKEYLTIYDKVKSKLPLELRDINKLSLNDLKDIALQYKGKEEEILTKNDYLDKKYKIKDSEGFEIYMFKTATEKDFKMYQLVSTNTEWCTRPDYDKFKDYISRSPLFVFIDKQDRFEKYQYHEISNQFKDAEDWGVRSELIIKLIPLISNYLPGDFIIRVYIDNSYGYINKQGKIVAKGFKNGWGFNEKIAALVLFNNNSYGFINKDGKIIAKGFKNGWGFNGGFAKVRFNDYSYGFINKNGKIIAKGFNMVRSFSEGFASVEFRNFSDGFLSKDLKFYEKDQKTLIPKDDPRLKGIKIYPENLK